jgi:hypothetical protein
MRCRRESADRAPAFVLPFSSATTLMAIMRFTVLLAVSSRLTVAYTIPFGMPRTATMATCAPPLARSMPVRCSGHGEEREPSPYNSRGCHLEWLGRRPSQCGRHLFCPSSTERSIIRSSRMQQRRTRSLSSRLVRHSAELARCWSPSTSAWRRLGRRIMSSSTRYRSRTTVSFAKMFWASQSFHGLRSLRRVAVTPLGGHCGRQQHRQVGELATQDSARCRR